MNAVRSLVAPLWRPSTYRRWGHLVLGGVLLLPVVVALLVATSLVMEGAAGPQATGMGPREWVLLVVSAGLGGLAAFVPGIAAQQVALARALVGGPLATQPAVVPTAWPSRARGALWLSLHLLVGMAISMTTMIVLTEAALLAMAPISLEPSNLLVPGTDGVVDGSAGPWIGPVLAAVLVFALVHLVAAIGAAAARLAPVLLGPSPADRLAAVEARADDLARRTHLAAELHDAIGHALSVVSLQASAAAQALDRDPAFAREALEAIAEQARTASGELDHVLGLIREEPADPAPRRTMADLPGLVAAVRATGTDVRVRHPGSLGLPPVLSTELYRLCQEAITNALRHGDGTAPITLELTQVGGRIELRVSNPIGNLRTRRAGRGLHTMRDRVQLLGGDLETSSDDDGWHVRARIPLGVLTKRPTP